MAGATLTLSLSPCDIHIAYTFISQVPEFTTVKKLLQYAFINCNLIEAGSFTK